ncbi:hypothetical protein M408DRAFT_28647 [Serendipita vermifera MAFF 305830]|uniref:Uncharacterized protein n=1 Tax=Serendipita vermifera MAFF 305830 TaxID=933852 RepID=A0A0C3AR40_SERVB|nr:hypothetical protein M408DRAFT_28647 [Serendipita vermifera MAFF 305830]
MVPPTAEQHQEQAPAQAQNEVIYSPNNPLYPQFDAGGDPRIPFDRGYAPVLPRTSHSQVIEDTPGNKTQLPHTRPSVPRPPRRSPPPPMIEEDSGTRIPITSPPAYSDGWTVGGSVANYTNEYNSTVHKSNAAGNELSYTFLGTQITVYGTLDAPRTKGPPSVTFSIDGSTPVAFNSTGTVVVDWVTLATSWLTLYQSPILSKAQHNITIQTGVPLNPDAHFYFDFFTVATGSDSASGNVVVDDRDPLVSYQGTWVDHGVGEEYLHTVRLAPNLGRGSATFSFNGTSASVFGTTDDATGRGTAALVGFSLDGVPYSNFTGPEYSTPVKHHRMFHAEGLSTDREHTIQMESLNANDWYLDCFVYETQISAGDDGGSKSNVGVIAGAVVAVVVGIAAVAAIVFMLLRRHKAKQNTWHREKQYSPRPDLIDEPESSESGISSSIPPSQAGITPFPSYSGFLTSPENRVFPVASPGVIPSSKELRNNASASILPNLVHSSVYSGIMSSGYGSTSLAGSETTVPTSPEQHPGHSQGLQGQSHGHIVISRHNQSYPQPDAAGSPGAPANITANLGNHGQISPGPTGEKAQFTHTRQPDLVPSTSRLLPPPVSPTIEQDSGIRLPRTSPPVYTAD